MIQCERNLWKSWATIEARYKNIRFYNNYNLSYSDSLYVDVYHFNDIGRKLYTEMVIRELSKFIN